MYIVVKKKNQDVNIAQYFFLLSFALINNTTQ